MSNTGKQRIAIAEDELLLLLLLESIVDSLGHEVVGSFGRVDEALRFAIHAEVDFAILDIRLRDGESFPVAAALRRRKIPFVFATGQDASSLPEEFRNELLLPKPYDPRALEQAIAAAYY